MRTPKKEVLNHPPVMICFEGRIEVPTQQTCAQTCNVELRQNPEDLLIEDGIMKATLFGCASARIPYKGQHWAQVFGIAKLYEL